MCVFSSSDELISQIFFNFDTQVYLVKIKAIVQIWIESDDLFKNGGHLKVVLVCVFYLLHDTVRKALKTQDKAFAVYNSFVPLTFTQLLYPY